MFGTCIAYMLLEYVKYSLVAFYKLFLRYILTFLSVRLNSMIATKHGPKVSLCDPWYCGQMWLKSGHQDPQMWMNFF